MEVFYKNHIAKGGKYCFSVTNKIFHLQKEDGIFFSAKINSPFTNRPDNHLLNNNLKTVNTISNFMNPKTDGQFTN